MRESNWNLTIEEEKILEQWLENNKDAFTGDGRFHFVILNEEKANSDIKRIIQKYNAYIDSITFNNQLHSGPIVIDLD